MLLSFMVIKSKKINKLWKKAEKIIPGGNGLISKRPDRYAPDIWPTYFKSCSGVNVMALNNNPSTAARLVKRTRRFSKNFFIIVKSLSVVYNIH